MTKRAIVADSVMTAEGITGDALVIEDGIVIETTWRHDLGDLARNEHPGCTLVPTFTDSHLHPIGYAALQTDVSLGEASNMSDVEELLRQRAASLPPGRAVLAQRLDDNSVGRMPDRHDLDRAVPDHPVVAYRICGHVAVANTAALDLAGIGPDTPDPTGGAIDRDADGSPTGVLRETALGLVAGPIDQLVDPPSPGVVLEALRGLLDVGISRIGAMVATSEPLWCGVGDELGTLCELASDLPLEVDAMVITDSPRSLEQAAEKVRSAGGRLRFWGWKEFADGSLGGHTAAMWEPFADRPTRGTLRLDPAHAAVMTRTAISLGGVAAIHAIGDRAIDETLDVFEALGGGIDLGGRARVEHASVASDTAIARMRDLGVVASVQPAFAASDGGWVRSRLGEGRPAYRFATMHAAGLEMIGGSDCPVERPDPLWGMAAAVARNGPDADQSLTAVQSLDLFTAAAARHLGQPRPLSPGSPANIVAVSPAPGEPGATVSAVYLCGAPLAPLGKGWRG